jgi:hypothetical protein
LLNAEAPFRRLLKWGIAAVWAGTAIAVLVATRIHPPTTIATSLNVRKISFQTTANRILGPSNDNQLLVSQVKSVQIHLSSPQSVAAGGATQTTSLIDITGGPFASCSFYHVRSDGFDLQNDSVLTISWDQAEGSTPQNSNSFSLGVHGLLSGNLTSQASAAGLIPGITCQHVQVNGGPAGDLESKLSPEGGDAISLDTATDARLDFDLALQNNIGDSQIPIRGEVRFWEVEPGNDDVKTVFLSGENKVTFEKVNQSFSLDEGDLLLIEPESDFYLRRFSIKNGIQLNLHGIVKEVKSGAGPKDMRTHMPSLFDQIDNAKRFWGVVPALVAFLLGLVDKLRRSPEKQ